jgi:hypothetical protein
MRDEVVSESSMNLDSIWRDDRGYTHVYRHTLGDEPLTRRHYKNGSGLATVEGLQSDMGLFVKRLATVINVTHRNRITHTVGNVDGRRVNYVDISSRGAVRSLSPACRRCDERDRTDQR